MSLVVCPSCGCHAFGAEVACPHCGLRGRPNLLALTAVFSLAAACSAPNDVYGPPPIDPAARVSASAVESNTAPTPNPNEMVAVYGPPPVDPTARELPVPSAAPSASASAAPSASVSAAPSALPTAKPPVKVYGPPPRDPKQRL